MRIGYLAAEVPALTMTFVYREIVGLQERGHHVSTFTVHDPKLPATDVDIGGYEVLYDRGAMGQFFAALPIALGMPLKIAGLKMQVIGDILKGLKENRARAMGLPLQALVAVRLAAMLKRDQIEHLHIHFAHAPAQIGMYAAKLAGIPFTVMGHANDIFEHPLLLKEKGERSAGFVMISKYNADRMAKAGVPPSKMPIVRCGLPDISEALPDRKEYRDAPVIGSLGRFVPKKGMIDLVEGFAHVLEAMPNARLEIVGDGPLRPEIEARIAELNLGDHVILKGAVANSEVIEWVKGLDLFTLACREDETGDMDGIPVALMEAMAYGVPVVSTKLSGIPELILDGQTGKLAQPDDPRGLGAAMLSLLQHPAEILPVRQMALDHLRSEFSLDVNLDRLERLFAGEAA